MKDKIKIKWIEYNDTFSIDLEKEEFFGKLEEIRKKENTIILNRIISRKDNIETILWVRKNKRNIDDNPCIYIYYKNIVEGEPIATYIDKKHKEFWNFLDSVCQPK